MTMMIPKILKMNGKFINNIISESFNIIIFRVEYVDCLGRTRTCLRKDLEHIKANDAELKQSRDKRKEHDEEPQKDVPKEEKEKTKEKQLNDEESELLSADMRREQLRKQWEKEEEELRDKTNIHYQDILFNGTYLY